MNQLTDAEIEWIKDQYRKHKELLEELETEYTRIQNQIDALTIIPKLNWNQKRELSMLKEQRAGITRSINENI